MSTQAEKNVLGLLEAVRALYARRLRGDDAIGRQSAAVLSLLTPLPKRTGRFPKNAHPVLQYIGAALAGGNEASALLLQSVGPVASYLPWHYTYPPRSDAPGLGESIAFAEIVGPEAPLRSERVCAGLTLIAPHTLYPAHRHPAIELYFVVAGLATWTLEGRSQELPPGSFVLHPSNGVHAMRTGQEPLLAVYSWSGADVRTTSTYTDSVQKL